VEYNSTINPTREWIMPYNENRVWDWSRYFGASLKSFDKLAKEKWYTLVASDSKWINAFFLRNDLIWNRFYIDKKDNITFHYRTPKYGYSFIGHPPRFVVFISNFLWKIK
jgi:hypothetical protein